MGYLKMLKVLRELGARGKTHVDMEKWILKRIGEEKKGMDQATSDFSYHEHSYVLNGLNFGLKVIELWKQKKIAWIREPESNFEMDKQIREIDLLMVKK